MQGVRPMRPILHVARLGRISYANALAIQHACRDRILSAPPGPSMLFLLEHSPPVYTIGLRSRDYTPNLEARLIRAGAEFHRTDRGGLITFHGPGQLVAYPVVSLRALRVGMKEYVARLERCLIEACRRLGVSAMTSEHTGVWVGDKKIAAIGVHGSRFVTTHGVALNCDTDLSWFDKIVPCGIEGKGVTSLSVQLNRVVTVAEASEHFMEAFTDVFGCSLVEGNKESYRGYSRDGPGDGRGSREQE